MACKLVSRGGRPSDPSWTIRRLVPFKKETWNFLKSKAKHMKPQLLRTILRSMSMKNKEFDTRLPVVHLLKNIKSNMRELEALKYDCEDEMYRFYHHSFKVYWLQDSTSNIVEKFKTLSKLPLNDRFLQIISEGTGKTHKMSHNRKWLKHTRPILEAFFHANYFLNMMIKYGKEFKRRSPNCLPSGWAAVLYLYNLRFII